MEFKRINMVLKIVFWFSIIIFSVSCNKKSETIKLKKKIINKNRNVKGFLWKIRKGNGTTYLYGVNFLAKERYSLDKVTKKCIDDSEILLVEFNFIKHIKKLNEIVKKYFYNYEIPLKDRIPENLYKRVYKFYKNYNYNNSRINKLSIKGAANGIKIKKYKKFGYLTRLSYYNNILNKFFNDNKKIIEFYDSPYEYFNELYNIGKKSAIFLLKQSLNLKDEEIKSYLEGKERYWKSGNIKEFIKIDKKLPLPEDMERHLDRIVKLYGQKIIDLCLIKEKNCFVLIGSSVVTNERNNVIKSLIQKGYKLKRIY